MTESNDAGDDSELERRVDELVKQLDELTERYFPANENAGVRRAPDIRELLREDIRKHLRDMLQRVADVKVCCCTHDSEVHSARGLGQCLGLDSYGMPCECPSFVEMEDDE